jgi:hypothetical protein
MHEFFAGLYVAFSLVATVFLMKFWRDSRDSLFVKFAAALLLLALERVMLVGVSVTDEDGSNIVFVLRLIAFSLIIWAMIDKNLRKPAK